MKFVDVTTLTQEAVAQTLGTTYLTKDGKLTSIESAGEPVEIQFHENTSNAGKKFYTLEIM